MFLKQKKSPRQGEIFSRQIGRETIFSSFSLPSFSLPLYRAAMRQHASNQFLVSSFQLPHPPNVTVDQTARRKFLTAGIFSKTFLLLLYNTRKKL